VLAVNKAKPAQGMFHQVNISRQVKDTRPQLGTSIKNLIAFTT